LIDIPLAGVQMTDVMDTASEAYANKHNNVPNDVVLAIHRHM